MLPFFISHFYLITTSQDVITLIIIYLQISAFCSGVIFSAISSALKGGGESKPKIFSIALGKSPVWGFRSFNCSIISFCSCISGANWPGGTGLVYRKPIFTKISVYVIFCYSLENRYFLYFNTLIRRWTNENLDSLQHRKATEKRRGN